MSEEGGSTPALLFLYASCKIMAVPETSAAAPELPSCPYATISGFMRPS